MAAVKQTKRNLPPGPGRPKGVPNKTTSLIKDMITQALDQAGGVDYLVERAQDPKTASAFLTLVGKVLPVQVTGDGGGPVVSEIVIRVVDADHG